MKATEETEDQGSIIRGLSNSEIIGNIFLCNFAGHETTANGLSYCILLLAIHPEVQEWVAEEAFYLLHDQGNRETWDYNLFPKFKRCLAIMVSVVVS